MEITIPPLVSMNAPKKIAFYACLSSLIRNVGFAEALANVSLRQYEEIKDQVTPEISMDFLREVYEEYHGSGDLDLITKLTENCFKDLAHHMRNPKARSVFKTWTQMSGTYEKEDLFIRTTNARHLTGDVEGPTVVTLVVNSYKGLKDFLKHNRAGYDGPEFVEEVHSV